MDLNDLLQALVDEGGSDLHISAGLPPRLRVHGELKPYSGAAAAAKEELLDAMQAICPPERWARFLDGGDADFAHALGDVARFRANYLQSQRGPAAVFRIIPAAVASLDELGLPDILQTLCTLRQGLLLVTGPTGSGKSTTLAAMIDHINYTQVRKIVTVEDPVEFVHVPHRSVIVHREVGTHTRSFAQAVHGAMRCNPDIVLVGEMRDLETIRLSLDCAAMGTLVLGTLHTNSAPKTIDRIIDAFAADEQPQIRILLAECLAGVVSQVLCRRADTQGRIAAHEILLRTEGLPNIIRDGKISSIRTVIEGGGADGMISLDESLRRLRDDGAIDAHEAYAKAADKDTFR